jgi:hypothetical protein
LNTKSRCTWLAGIVGGLLLAAGAIANQIPGVLITGHVTSASNGDWVTVDGRSYRIPAGSPAASAARALTQGQYVDIRLSGPPTAASSVVISVAPHQE